MRRMRTNVSLGPLRPVCKHGTACYRANPAHLAEEAHPADDDYLQCCAEAKVKPEFVSIRKLFEFCDSGGKGKVSKESVANVWDTLQKLGKGLGSLDSVWDSLDDDGNGYLNFSEFAEFTTSYSVGLPLGLDDLLQRSSTGDIALRCGVLGCPCRHFSMRKPRCKYGEACYQKSEEHRRDFLHPGDEGWQASATQRDKNMCRCGHKQSLHASPLVGIQAVEYPAYWQSELKDDKEVNQRYTLGAKLVPFFQQLIDGTYRDVTTRDRVTHCKTWMVPRNFQLYSVQRNENSRLWRKYKIKRSELEREVSLSSSCGSGRSSVTLQLAEEFATYTDVLTTNVWEQMLTTDSEGMKLFSRGEVPDRSINEWILFHGTSASAAENICGHDFTMRLAGSSTGTLYGRGTYLAESITKADEYSREESGVFTVLVCRVLGGRVRYCDEKTPDADALMSDCTEGLYDSILGDRVKCSGTYREFVVFDTENVYPEFVLKYKRGEFFKSPSHP